jgi:hypothetical protein
MLIREIKRMGNLFVEDHDIHVAKSPFSAYEGERKKFDGRINGISLDHIMIKVKREDVFGVDYDILEAISDLEFSTSRMITQYLNLKGIMVEQSKVQSRLNFLNKLTIISRYKIVNDETETNTRIYCLERVGKYLLLSRDKPCKWVATDSARPLSTMKRILARNQAILTYRSRLNNIEKYIFNPVFKIITSNKVFKPDIQITFINRQGAKEVMLLEVARSYEGCIEKTIESLKNYKEYIDSFSPTPNMLEPPYMGIVGEDEEHIYRIFKGVVENKIQPLNREFLYTTDTKIINSELHRSFIQYALIRQEDGKVKTKIKELNFELFK